MTATARRQSAASISRLVVCSSIALLCLASGVWAAEDPLQIVLDERPNAPAAAGGVDPPNLRKILYPHLRPHALRYFETAATSGVSTAAT
ncbi:hypothetical protein M3Y99_00774800 [Aphelenchoides fujianensis]|nr:hypothetical protein M3Y99_00774800 [Aphelenchoides fujianensis]